MYIKFCLIFADFGNAIWHTYAFCQLFPIEKCIQLEWKFSWNFFKIMNNSWLTKCQKVNIPKLWHYIKHGGNCWNLWAFRQMQTGKRNFFFYEFTINIDVRETRKLENKLWNKFTIYLKSRKSCFNIIETATMSSQCKS